MVNKRLAMVIEIFDCANAYNYGSNLKKGPHKSSRAEQDQSPIFS